MMHEKRPYTLVEIADLDLLCEKLRQHSWTLCSGWRWRSLSIVNDSFSEDSIQEYAIIKNGHQIESLTVSWFESSEDLASTLSKLDADGGLDFGPVNLKSHPEGVCSRCA